MVSFNYLLHLSSAQVISWQAVIDLHNSPWPYIYVGAGLMCALHMITRNLANILETYMILALT